MQRGTETCFIVTKYQCTTDTNPTEPIALMPDPVESQYLI